MNNHLNDGGPAFAIPFPSVAVPSLPVHLGMSLRDYFAAAALQGLIADGGGASWEADANAAYKAADAMIKAREVKP